ncbi:hypothetical protein [Ralstonia pseudosolanacearum]|uniref:hypothetical protein n=1 Tax=Ralstonia pseudosolanacearum TaxID=1310165 RepID=UPI0023DAC5C0|nr:hypothetical protein [Ralstonia pseudosolanacearum]
MDKVQLAVAPLFLRMVFALSAGERLTYAKLPLIDATGLVVTTQTSAGVYTLGADKHPRLAHTIRIDVAVRIVRLIVGFSLLSISTLAAAEDVSCTVTATAEETPFAPREGTNAVLAARAGIQLAAGEMVAKYNAAAAQTNGFSSGLSGKNLHDILVAAKPNWEAIRRQYAAGGSGGGTLSGGRDAASFGIDGGLGWNAGGGVRKGPDEGGPIAPDSPGIHRRVTGTHGGAFGYPPSVTDPAPELNDDPVGGDESGGGILVAGGGGVPRPSAGPNAVTTGSDEQGTVLGLQKGRPLTPPQKKLLNNLISKPESLSCTQQVFRDAIGTMNVVDFKFGGNPNGPIEAREWQKYLANPSGYGGAPDRAQAFADAVAAMKALLQKCFKPASQHPAYAELNIPQRLGFISVDGRHSCQGLLISKDHILTARHCWFDSPNNEPVTGYAKGAAYFVPSGSTGKRYQICAAETLLKGTSASLNSLDEEQVVMRIAPVNYDLPKLDVSSPADIKVFPSEETPPPDAPVTMALTFTWVNGASKFDPTYKGDLAVGTVPCFVVAYDVTAHCVINMCPTYEGTSGGPVFTQDAVGKWRFLGIHLGAAAPADHVYPTCVATTASDKENSVLMPNMSLLTKFSIRGNQK